MVKHLNGLLHCNGVICIMHRPFVKSILSLAFIIAIKIMVMIWSKLNHWINSKIIFMEKCMICKLIVKWNESNSKLHFCCLEKSFFLLYKHQIVIPNGNTKLQMHLLLWYAFDDVSLLLVCLLFARIRIQYFHTSFACLIMFLLTFALLFHIIPFHHLIHTFKSHLQ